MKMYFLLMGIFQPAMLVYQRIPCSCPKFSSEFVVRVLPRKGTFFSKFLVSFFEREGEVRHEKRSMLAVTNWRFQGGKTPFFFV